MKRFFMLILLVISLSVSTGATAQEYTGPDVQEFYGCEYGDPDLCMWAGTAPGITSCTSNQGCKQCGVDDITRQLRCYTAMMANGSCGCQVKTLKDGSVQCDLSGDCTYRK